MKRSLTKSLRTFHLCAGLTMGALFCVLSLSGSVLVFRPTIEELLRPRWTPKSSARASQVLTVAAGNISRQWPDAQIAGVSLPERPGPPIEFGVRTVNDGQLRVFADARSGEVLGTFALPWLDWVMDLHHHLQVPSIGKKIVGFFGIGLFLSSLTGLLIWTFRFSGWARLFWMRKGALWQPTKFDAHRSAGVIGNALLLFVAATGIAVAFPQTVERLLGVPSDAVKPRRARGAKLPKKPAVRAALEEYVAAAKNAVPGSVVRQLRVPETAGAPVTARLFTPGDLRPEGSTRVSLEPGTARVLAVDRPEDWPLAKRIVQAATPLHYAEWGGLPLRIGWSLIGLLPPVLFVSGVMMWWAPFRARRRAVRAATARALEREEDLVM